MKTLIEWWQRSQSQIFLTLSFIWPVVLYFAIPCRPVYMAGVYIFIVTGLIVFVKNQYRESIRQADIPKLEIPAKKKKTEKAVAPALDIQEILLKEFEYAKETAVKAMDDRQSITNTYLVSIGGAVLAGIVYMMIQKDSGTFPYLGENLVALGLITNAVGWFFFLLIIRLRQGWLESARAMNHIKQVFAKNSLYDPQVAKKSFRWNIESVPQAAKKMTIFHFSAVLISIPCSGAIVLAGIILLGTKYSIISWLIPWILGLYHFIFQMSMYTVLLEES